MSPISRRLASLLALLLAASGWWPLAGWRSGASVDAALSLKELAVEPAACAEHARAAMSDTD